MRHYVAIIGSACNTEVGQQNPAFTGARIGEQDIRRLDVSVQQVALVGVVKSSAIAETILHTSHVGIPCG